MHFDCCNVQLFYIHQRRRTASFQELHIQPVISIAGITSISSPRRVIKPILNSEEMILLACFESSSVANAAEKCRFRTDRLTFVCRDLRSLQVENTRLQDESWTTVIITLQKTVSSLKFSISTISYSLSQLSYAIAKNVQILIVTTTAHFPSCRRFCCVILEHAR